MNPTYLLLFGPPGSGKGTQGRRLSRALGMPHVVTSEVLREAIAPPGAGDEKPWGTSMKAGEPLPAHYVVPLLEREFSREACATGAIIDGFPYTLQQAIVLDNRLNMANHSISLAIYLSAPADILMRRIHERWSGQPPSQQPRPGILCPGSSSAHKDERYRRRDDRPEIAVKRVAASIDRMPPITEYYRRRGTLHEVDASKSEDEVYGQIVQRLPIES